MSSENQQTTSTDDATASVTEVKSQTLEQKHRMSSRRGSSIGIMANPLEDEGEITSSSKKRASVKVEDLTTAKNIGDGELKNLIVGLQSRA